MSFKQNISLACKFFSRYHGFFQALLFVSIFGFYYIWSLRYSGPAYLSDEIGYLTKAATLAGYTVDSASSWHAGYPLLLAPLFKIFSDPSDIWRGIMALNAAMFTASLIVLRNYLKIIFPKKSHLAIFGAVVVTALYPGWITMTGYAFSTPAFVLFFMLSLSALLRVNLKNPYTVIPFSLLTSFIYWIHPIGLAVVVVAGLVLALKSKIERNVTSLLLFVGIAVLSYFLYNNGIHAWLSGVMTPENFKAGAHYEKFGSGLSNILKLEFWAKLILVILGKLSYLLIATLGIATFAISFICIRLKKAYKLHKTFSAQDLTLMFISLSLLGVIVLGALMFSVVRAESALRPDHWIYGRYLEMVLMPLLATGLLAKWRFRYAVLASLFVAVVGFIFYITLNSSNTDIFNNLVNIPALWPLAFFSEVSYIRWLLIGSLGISLVGILKKPYFAIVVIPLFISASQIQANWHSDILNNYSKPSELNNTVRENFPDQCLNLDPRLPPDFFLKERPRMYSFYLYDYQPTRMSFENWLKEGSCGIYMTYYSVDHDDVIVIGKEGNTGLHLLAKPDLVDYNPVNNIINFQEDTE